MKHDIIIAGVGGQGILSIAATIGYAALKDNLYVKQSEVHGMSQRGGAVISHFRISDKEIASDLVPVGSADFIVAVEPMESLRHLPFLAPNGWLVTNSRPYINIPDYPPIEEVLNKIKEQPQQIIVDADNLAREIKSPKSSNIVILGALSAIIDIPFVNLQFGIEQLFGRKGKEVVASNIKALELGRDKAKGQLT